MPWSRRLQRVPRPRELERLSHARRLPPGNSQTSSAKTPSSSPASPLHPKRKRAAHWPLPYTHRRKRGSLAGRRPQLRRIPETRKLSLPSAERPLPKTALLFHNQTPTRASGSSAPSRWKESLERSAASHSSAQALKKGQTHRSSRAFSESVAFNSNQTNGRGASPR